ncbi:hypothetical protein EGD00_20725 [Pectobacterium carotovorum subsp. carotovorum]|nr:hypothetical protein EGD00_20725 [Pectobacterium carotovorum subsp. carotovorum]
MNYIYQLCIAIVAGGFGAWVATFFALRRFYSEKWWEKRASAFIELTNSIYQIKVLQEYYSDLKEYERYGSGAFPIFTKLSGSKLEEMQSAACVANELIIKYSEVGPLLITENALGLLRKYLQEEKKVEHDVHYNGLDTDEAEEQLLVMIQELFKKILKESKKELRAK